MSRKLRHNRSAKTQQPFMANERTMSAENEGNSPLQLPPRSKKFPSSSQILNKWYYHLLFLLFIGLVAFLFWYGMTFSS